MLWKEQSWKWEEFRFSFEQTFGMIIYLLENKLSIELK